MNLEREFFGQVEEDLVTNVAYMEKPIGPYVMEPIENIVQVICTTENLQPEEIKITGLRYIEGEEENPIVAFLTDPSGAEYLFHGDKVVDGNIVLYKITEEELDLTQTLFTKNRVFSTVTKNIFDDVMTGDTVEYTSAKGLANNQIVDPDTQTKKTAESIAILMEGKWYAFAPEDRDLRSVTNSEVQNRFSEIKIQ